MPYLGNEPATQFTDLKYQDLTGGSGTSFTLDYAVGNAQAIEVFVNNVRQEPGVAYTVSGTTLTMTGTIASTDDFYVIFQGMVTSTATHPATSNLEAADGTFTGNVSITGTTSSTGAITATAGIIVPSGQGIDFSATSDGSGTTTSEFFDDYEEGTFLPFVSSGVTSPTYTVQKGRYTKIGRVVNFELYIDLATGTANSSQYQLGGLPFTSSSDNNGFGGAYISYQGGFRVDRDIAFWINLSSTLVIAYFQSNGSPFAGTNADGVLNTIILVGTYYTD